MHVLRAPDRRGPGSSAATNSSSSRTRPLVPFARGGGGGGCERNPLSAAKPSRPQLGNSHARRSGTTSADVPSSSRRRCRCAAQTASASRASARSGGADRCRRSHRGCRKRGRARSRQPRSARRAAAGQSPRCASGHGYAKRVAHPRPVRRQPPAEARPAAIGVERQLGVADGGVWLVAARRDQEPPMRGRASRMPTASGDNGMIRASFTLFRADGRRKAGRVAIDLRPLGGKDFLAPRAGGDQQANADAERTAEALGRSPDLDQLGVVQHAVALDLGCGLLDVGGWIGLDQIAAAAQLNRRLVWASTRFAITGAPRSATLSTSSIRSRLRISSIVDCPAPARPRGHEPLHFRSCGCRPGPA